MRFSFTVHQKFASEAGITNGNVLLVFEILASASKWADTVCMENDCYYFTARQMVAEELSLWGMKPDTVYRHFRTLVDLKLIEYTKRGKQDLTRLTKKGKAVFSNTNLGNESELDQNSEMNPSKFGNESEKNSEMNPTYHTTTTFIPTTKEKKETNLSLVNHEESDKPKPDNPDPRIGGGRFVNTCDGGCNYDYNSTLCQTCKSKKQEAVTFSENMLKNFDNTERWQTRLRAPLQKTIAKHWFEFGKGFSSHDISTAIDTMLDNYPSTDDPDKRVYLSVAIERAVRSLS